VAVGQSDADRDTTLTAPPEAVAGPEPGTGIPGPDLSAPPHNVAMPRLTRLLLTVCAVVAILAFATAVRLYGLNWDDGYHLHPDERFLAIVGSAIRFPSDPMVYFDTHRSPLNPYNNNQDGFAYGEAPLFLVRAIADRLGMASYDLIPIVGRVASAAADVGTVFLVFLLGRLVYGTAVGLVGAMISAACVLQIQLSHFFAVDTFLAFATTLALYFAYRAWFSGGVIWFTLLGLAAGLALSTKLSAALLAPVIILATVVPVPGSKERRAPLDMVSALAICGLMSLLVYRIGEPYSFLGPGFLGIVPNMQRFTDLNKWVQISSGEIEVPFMIQWAGTPNPRFALEAILRWGLGPPAAIAAYLGLALATVQMVRWQRYSRHLLLVAWAIINLGYFSFQFAKFLRYFIPVYPALAILAAYFLVTGLPGLVSRWGRPARSAALALTPIVVILTVLYAISFLAIYGRPNTRIQASNWIYDNVPVNSTLGVEHWDDSLPLRLPGREYKYAEVTMTLYDDESPELVRKFTDTIDKADYLILASNRLYGSIPRLPARYPVAIEYYRALFDGRLGFDLVGRFDSNPELFGITIDSTGAQEDFTVYDHPTVMIFKKAPRYSRENVASLLGSVPLDGIEHTKPVEAGQRRGLMLTPTEMARVATSGTWADKFTLDGLTTRLALPIWLLVVELLGLAAFPLCWLLLPGLADRGYGAAKILGLVLVSYLSWLAASLGLATFGRPLALGSFLALALVGVGVVVQCRHALLADLRQVWRRLAAVEVVFLIALAVMVGIRMFNPDLWHPNFGGEKPMDFAYLNAIIKTPSFPPYDPWFAGGYINYYYYGFVLVAVLVHLSSVPPFVAYNLAIATVFALTLAAAFSVGISIVAGPAGRRGVGKAAIAAGTISALSLGVLGNLDGALQILEGLWKLGGDGIASGLPVVTGLTRALVGLGVLATGGHLQPFDFWRSTRFIGPEEPGPIHEFPFFTFLYGDLHAHMLSLPLQVLTILVGIQIVRLSAREVLAPLGLRDPATRAEALRALARPLALIAVSGLLVGTLRATNTWELPTYTALIGLLAFVAMRPGRWVPWLPAIAAGGVVLGLVYSLSSAFFWPYLARYELFYSGFTPVKTPTNPSQFLLANGALLFALTGYLLLQLARVAATTRSMMARERRRLPAPAGAYLVALAPTMSVGADGRVSTLATGLLAVGLMLWLVGYGTLGLLLAIGGSMVVLVIARRSSREMLLVLSLAAAAVGAFALPEVAAVKGDVGRMNTVFKFYLQAWVLLSLLAGPAVVLVYRALVRVRRLPNVSPAGRYAWLTAIVLIGVGTAVYPLLATRTKVPLRFESLPPTLDGMAYMAEAKYEDKGRDLDLPSDWRAIRWMFENVEGTPTILEGNAPLYHWGSRFSIYTGLPTVLGWDWHQKQQRMAYSNKVDERVRDVQRAYESPDPQAATSIIQKYGVKLIVVGGLERAYYPAAGLAKFDKMVGQGLEVAYQDGSVTIYRVVAPAG
jgi:YYY domain-containing protein